MASDDQHLRPSAAAAAAAAPKSRRPHRKSRDGCAECKRRHIRCDKGRPACTNCTIAERACAYPPGSAAAIAAAAAAGGGAAGSSRAKAGMDAKGNDTPPVSSPNGASAEGRTQQQPPPPLLVTPKIEEPLTPAGSISPSEPKPFYPRLPFHLGAFSDGSSPGAAASSSTSTPIAQQPHPQPPLQPSTFSTKDLVLLHHASTSMPDAILGRGQTTYIIDIALRYAVDSPYLVNQLLAFAALHLAHMQNDLATTGSLRNEATELQTRALAEFAKETEFLTTLPPASEEQQTDQEYQQQQQHQPLDDAYHGVPRFLFASVLGLHVFAETLLYHHHDFSAFLNNFTDCMHLHRGVRTVLKPTWEGLLQTELGPLFSALSHATATRQKGQECDNLLESMKQPEIAGLKIEEAVRETCLEAVEHIQWGFDLQARLSEAEGPHAPSAVSVMLPGPFVDLLRQLQPLALVVLAYFGVLVHRSRRFWIFGDSGTFVIRAVAGHLGGEWEESLRWPLEQLEKI